MDDRVNDFFNEINEIAPPTPLVKSTRESVWQECFDEGTGYPYYWNMHTNAVTWQIPSEYQDWLDKVKLQKPSTKAPSAAKKPLFPSVANTTTVSTLESKTISTYRNNDYSTGSQELKKIRALPSYLIDSDHDSLEANMLSQNGSVTNSPLHSNNSKANSRASSDTETAEELKPTLGFSLLANYGNYSEDEEELQDDEPASLKPEVTESASTLFPITKPIDVNQFSQTTEKKEILNETEHIDAKAFKRKRRIGVHLVNHQKRERDVLVTNENESNIRVKNNEGDKEDNIGGTVKKKYMLTFVKGDTLEPSYSTNVQAEDSDRHKRNEDDSVDDTQKTLKEKLTFLSEGRDPISPVQVMCIQLETLYNAWKSENLNSSYFTTWIKTISNELIKLEEDATPEGWTLEWDRQEKRYFYRNKSTNDCQWEYPQQLNNDVESGHSEPQPESEHKTDDDDDAMDICTTPPPVDTENIGSNIEVTSFCTVPTDETVYSKEENHWETKAKGQESSDINLVLDSFYSDIAAIETASVVQTEQHIDQPEAENIHTSIISNVPNNSSARISAATSIIVKDSSSTLESVKKKKKVKMSHGISMKKKGVSELVEKWKNVQRNLD